MTRLPAVFAQMSSASRIGTPDEISVPSVRVKRATATLRSSEPKTGIFRKIASVAVAGTRGERLRAWRKRDHDRRPSPTRMQHDATAA